MSGNNELTREQVFEVLKIHSVPPAEAGKMLEQIERILYITAGLQTVLVASVRVDISEELLIELAKQFDQYGVSVVFIPSELNMKVEGVVTARSWRQGFVENLHEIARRLRREVRNA